MAQGSRDILSAIREELGRNVDEKTRTGTRRFYSAQICHREDAS
jgi:hypothetical protein